MYTNRTSNSPNFMSTPSSEILIVEDEVKIAQLLSDYLRDAGYATSILLSGEVAVETIKTQQPACVVLDVMLPGKDGLTICREVRAESDVPIVMVTARVDEIDRLLGLELGADDYICKPFSPREVVVRIRNILRRVERTAAPVALPEGELQYGSLHLDTQRLFCELEGTAIVLTAVEFRMLFAMVKRPGHIFSRDQLMSLAYVDERVVSDRTIDTHIKNLRKKMYNVTDEEVIHSVYSVGYKVE